MSEKVCEALEEFEWKVADLFEKLFDRGVSPDDFREYFKEFPGLSNWYKRTCEILITFTR